MLALVPCAARTGNAQQGWARDERRAAGSALPPSRGEAAFYGEGEGGPTICAQGINLDVHEAALWPARYCSTPCKDRYTPAAYTLAAAGDTIMPPYLVFETACALAAIERNH